MRLKHHDALRTAFADFGWHEVRGEATEHMGEMYAFVVEAPDGSLHGAVPMSTQEDDDGWVGHAPLDGNVAFVRPTAEAVEASRYRLVSP